MRISVRDPEYKRGIVNAVYLDGERVAYCTAADEEAGTVTRAKLDCEGKVTVDRFAEEVVEETVSGKVRIEMNLAEG